MKCGEMMSMIVSRRFHLKVYSRIDVLQNWSICEFSTIKIIDHHLTTFKLNCFNGNWCIWSHDTTTNLWNGHEKRRSRDIVIALIGDQCCLGHYPTPCTFTRLLIEVVKRIKWFKARLYILLLCKISSSS